MRKRKEEEERERRREEGIEGVRKGEDIKGGKGYTIRGSFY